MASTIQIRRGVEANRGAVTFAAGEIFYVTDTNEVWIGDGSTAGGIDFVGNHDIPVANIDGTQNNLITFDGSGDATLIAAGTDNHVLQSVAGVPTYQFIAFDNVASADFITDLSTAPGANKFVDAATVRSFVLSNLTGLAWRPPVRVRDNVTTDFTTLEGGTSITVDSIVLANDDRVLFTNEATASENDRVYIVAGVGSSVTLTVETDGQAGTGAPTDGDALIVQEGTDADKTFVYDGSNWVVTASLNGALLAANNLSDVANAATSLSNIGGIGAATTDTLQNKTITSSNAGGNNTLSVDYLDIATETAGDIFFWTTGGVASKLTVGSPGQVLTVSAGLPVWAAAAGTGDVNGPGSATDNGVCRFDGTTGKIIQDGSGVTITDTGDINGATLDGGSF